MSFQHVQKFPAAMQIGETGQQPVLQICSGVKWRKNVRFVKWVFPKIGAPQNEWFIMESHIKIDTLGVPQFLETSKISKFTLVIQCHQFFYIFFLGSHNTNAW